MSPIYTIGLLSLFAILSFLFGLTSLVYYLPQIISLLIVILAIFHFQKKSLIYPLSFIINLIVFSTHGLSSPFLSLEFFLLTVVSFIYLPIVALGYSLVIVILLSQTLNSISSLFVLFSFLLISPLVWLISQQNRLLEKDRQLIITNETDFLLWLNLKFKNSIISIIDLCSQLQSTPQNPTTRQSLKKIKDSAKSLLHSSQQLTSEISSTDNDQEI